MSGHSKWSKVKHQKATTDVIKAQHFTRASRAITIAVKEGGGVADPNGNFKLRLAIGKAREVNMPKDNIERAIAKAKGDGTETIESLLYEAYGPHGVALLIEAATENRQRTVSQLKNILDRNGGVLAAQGAVAFQFSRMGIIVIEPQANRSQDDMLGIALDAGAQDVIFYDDAIEVYTALADLEKVKAAIEEKGIVITTSELIYRPTIPVQLPEEQTAALDAFVELVEELEDVQKVHTNIVK